MKLGFIGTGIMGEPMARNLLERFLKEGVGLVVHNRSKGKASELIKGGAIWAETPGDVGEKADIIFTMLRDPDVVYETALGKDGLLEKMGEGKIWVDCSTVHPSFSEQMGAVAEGGKIRFIDGPVSGSLKPAEDGNLIFLLGGAEEDVESVRPFLECMGSRIIHAGPNGAGSSFKLVVNLIMGSVMAGFTEGLTLGESMGLNKEFLLDNLLGMPITPQVLAGKKEKFLNDEFSPEFPLELIHKDLHLVSNTAYQKGVTLPVSSTVKDLFGAAKMRGLGREDFSALYKHLKCKDGDGAK